MRRTKEILRLRFESGLGLRQIARGLSISVGTVHDYLQRAEAAGVTWPLPEGFDDNRLEASLFRQPAAPVALRKAPPDYPAVHQELQKPHVTLQLLWEEYQEANPGGYRYSRFCELYQRWRRKQDVVLRQQHKPGERMFVDWAGATIPIHNRSTGEVTPAPLFVATLGASSYTYAETARPAMELAGEPGSGTTAEERETSGQSLRGRHRLPHRPRTGQECNAGTGAGVGMGKESRERFRSWSNRRREELYRLGARAKGVPGRLLGFLHAGSRAIPRVLPRAC